MASTGAAAGRLTGGDPRVLITVQDINDLRRRFFVRVRPESTVREFRLVISIMFGVPVDQQILIHMGHLLWDERTMGSYGLQNGHVINLAHSFVPAISFASASVAPASASVAADAPVPGNGISDILSGVGTVQSQRSGGSSDVTVPGLLIHVRISSETMFDIRVRPELTVGEFKGLITELQNIPVNEQRLIYSGHFLQDERTIGSYGVQEGHVIHLARRSIPATSSASASVAAATPTGGNSTPDILTGVAFVQIQGFGGGASSFFGNGLPGFGQVQQHILGNPDMMGELMNIPATQDLLNNLNDPEIISNMVINNLSYSELLHALNNPDALHQRVEATRNRELMRAIIRDRIMGNVAHRQMYENIQESLLNASSRTGLDGNFPPSYTYANSGSYVPSNSLPNSWATIAVAPEELYAYQLSQLQEMGFTNTHENIQALIATSGDVPAAMYRLLQNFGQ